MAAGKKKEFTENGDEIETTREEIGDEGSLGGRYEMWEIKRNKRTGEIIEKRRLWVEKLDNR